MVSAIRKLGSNVQRPASLVFAVGLFTALIVVLVVWPRQAAVLHTDDPYGFSVLGRSIAEGRGFAQVGTSGIATMRRAPLYPAMIALIYTLAGPHTVLVRLTQCLLTGGTGALAFGIGNRIFGKQTGLIAGLLCAFHPMVLRLRPRPSVESLLTFFTTLMVYCGVRFVQTPSLSAGFALGCRWCIGLAREGRAGHFARPFLRCAG